MTPLARLPAAAAQVDLAPRQVVVAACAATGVVVGIDLIDGTLDAIFSIGFVLIVIAAALAVDPRGFVTAGLLPPLLLIGALGVVAFISADAIVVEGLAADTGAIGRVIAGVFDRGIALLVGYGCALAIIAARAFSVPD